MNKKQKMVILISAGLLAMMILFPPWDFYCHAKTVNGPYSFVLSNPPTPKIDRESLYKRGLPYDMRNPFFNGYKLSEWKAKINLIRMIFPMAAVILISFGLFIYLKEKK